MITHTTVIANILQLNCAMKLPPKAIRESCLCILPQSHIYGLVTISQAPIHRGAGVVVLPGFDIKNTLAAVQRYSITTLFFVCATFQTPVPPS
jgi:acyl-CoA synthetase (AMP-forming)/AMP-acid ligase II